MRKWRAGAVLLGCLLADRAAYGHRIDEYLQATLVSVQADGVRVSMRMIPGVVVAPEVIAAIDTDHDGAFSDAEERAYARRVLSEVAFKVDGRAVQAEVRGWSFPQLVALRDGLGEIHLEYWLGVAGGWRTLTVANAHMRGRSVYLVNAVEPADERIRIAGQRRSVDQASYELELEPGAGGGWGTRVNVAQAASLFRLGMRHIAEGTDHLLFLLALLLPAPLVAEGGRWVRVASGRVSLLRIVGIVTAFTVGHSVTLTLAAMGVVRVPGRPVEVLIAVSILVSAVHALRPLFPGREAWIAGFFGLIHGLAFAATLERLGLTRWDRVAGILAFNVGIEAMQMMVVAVALPVLLLASRTRWYGVVRWVGGGAAAAAAAVWMVERVGTGV